MSTALRRLRADNGQGIISGLILLAGVLLPLMFVIPLFARIEQAHLAADQAARAAVRAAVEAPSAGDAPQAAQAAVDETRAQTGVPLTLDLQGTFARGETLTVHAVAEVQVGTLPFLGSFGTIHIDGKAQAPVDQYRSLPADGSP
jgi:hypothetical protein